MPPTPAPWADQPDVLLRLALDDLRSTGDVQPTLVAFTGDQPMAVVTLRRFAKGEHQDPIIEAAGLLAALGADRFALSLAGRAWSMDDPIPPVLPGVGDLRQQVVVVHLADAATGAPPRTVITPVEGGRGRRVRTGEPIDRTDGVGWVPMALGALAGSADRFEPLDDAALHAEIARYEVLGHRFAWGPTWVPRIRRLRRPRAA